jgi:UDP-N-acetylglucosamine 2-epimerase (non-hydrolysing)
VTNIPTPSGLKVIADSDLTKRCCVVVGTRPGIIKQSPVIRALGAAGIDHFVLHTGQHYSDDMDATFFRDLGLPEPLHRLDQVRNYTTHGGQTAEMLRGIESVLIEERPRFVIVGGDANTNLAGALAARKLQLTVGHVEAGLRSYDWRMPEEHNRVMIDHISDYLFAPTDAACRHLEQDAVRGKIVLTGNTIVDAVHQNLELARKRGGLLVSLGLQPRSYFVLTVHREETVDTHDNLASLLDSINAVAAEHPRTPIIFAVHPRTVTRFEAFGLEERVAAIPGLRRIQPLGYLDFLQLLAGARLVLTDSGGIQEESCILNVPCVTLRDNTERPETVEVGANAVAGLSPEGARDAVSRMLQATPGWENPFGDGRAGERIASVVAGCIGSP